MLYRQKKVLPVKHVTAVSFSHCCHSHCCRTFFAPTSHRTAGIRTIDIRTLVSSHCWPFRTVGIRTVGFALVSFALLSFALLSYKQLIPKTIGNRKKDCAWGCAWGINTTWENLQIEKHKSVRWAERTPSWFVLFDLQIFSGGVYSPSATSRTIFFSISNSFWY